MDSRRCCIKDVAAPWWSGEKEKDLDPRKFTNLDDGTLTRFANFADFIVSLNASGSTGALAGLLIRTGKIFLSPEEVKVIRKNLPNDKSVTIATAYIDALRKHLEASGLSSDDLSKALQNLDEIKSRLQPNLS